MQASNRVKDRKTSEKEAMVELLLGGEKRSNLLQCHSIQHEPLVSLNPRFLAELPASDGRNSGLDKFIDSAPKW
jgi:hypothetical protein